MTTATEPITTDTVVNSPSVESPTAAAGTHQTEVAAYRLSISESHSQNGEHDRTRYRLSHSRTVYVIIMTALLAAGGVIWFEAIDRS